MRSLWVIGLLGQLVLTIPALGQQSRTVSYGRVPLEILTGAAGAVAGGFSGGYLGAATIGPHGGEDPGLLGAVLGVLIGIPVGAATGTYLGARIHAAKPDFSDALGGAGL